MPLPIGVSRGMNGKNGKGMPFPYNPVHYGMVCYKPEPLWDVMEPVHCGMVWYKTGWLNDVRSSYVIIRSPIVNRIVATQFTIINWKTNCCDANHLVGHQKNRGLPLANPCFHITWPVARTWYSYLCAIGSGLPSGSLRTVPDLLILPNSSNPHTCGEAMEVPL